MEQTYSLRYLYRHLLYISMCLVLLLFGCKTSEPAAVAGQPVVVGTDTVATLTAVTVGKKSTVTVQIGGTGNQASAAKTDNTGRNASQGANGGHSEAKSTSTPLWVYVALFVAGGAVVVWWQRRKASKAAAVLLVLLTFGAVPAFAQKQLVVTWSRYSYKKSRQAERIHRKTLRYFRRLHRQELHHNKKALRSA